MLGNALLMAPLGLAASNSPTSLQGLPRLHRGTGSTFVNLSPLCVRDLALTTSFNIRPEYFSSQRTLVNDQGEIKQMLFVLKQRTSQIWEKNINNKLRKSLGVLVALVSAHSGVLKCLS